MNRSYYFTTSPNPARGGDPFVQPPVAVSHGSFAWRYANRMLDRPRHEAVLRDMAGAFGDMPVTKGNRPGSPIVVVGCATTSKRSSARWPGLAAPAAVAAMLAGLLGYAELSGRMSVARPAEAAVAQQPASTGSAPARAMLHEQAAQLVERASVPTRTSVFPPAAAPAKVATLRSPQAPTAQLPQPTQVTTGLVDPSIDRDGPGQGSNQVAELRNARDGCRPNSPDDECIYADVMRADRRLHAAYTQAVRVGVRRAALVSANRRWRQARELAEDRPDEAIRRYDALASDLDRYVADGTP